MEPPGPGTGKWSKVPIQRVHHPFPENQEERQVTADPRASILERYPNAESYVEAVRAASRQLVEERYMLEEDLERCVEWAKDWDRLRHRIRLP